MPIHSAPADVTADQYRSLMASFPTGVAVVTAVDGFGLPHGMTCTSLASVTLRPPTLMVCLCTSSGTLAAIRDRGAFAVNLLHAGARPIAELFSAPNRDRFAAAPWAPAPRLGVPALTEDALAVAECRVRMRFPVGDHDVVLGEVVGVDTYAGNPLLYGQRRYGCWDAAPLEAVAW